MSDDGSGRSEGSGEEAADLTHTDEEGSVDMVDVGNKPDTARRAVARGRIRLQPATVDAIRQNAGAKRENESEENDNGIEKGENEVRRGENGVGKRENDVEKGDVLATARIGAIQAVKHTWETIPLCHQIPITNVETGYEFDASSVTLTVAVETTGKTGCEMEALEGVTTGLNVVWDMVKAAEKDADGQYPGTRIENVEVVRKEKSELGSD